MAIMWTTILENVTLNDIVIDDIGLPIDATSTIQIDENEDWSRIANSDDLREKVTNGNIVINNGVTDLSASDGVDFLKIVHVYYLKQNYYTKTNLQTSGEAEVHWDNITNTPDFSFDWLEHVKAIILGFYSAAPAGTEGDFYVDTDDDTLYKYISSSWVSQGAPSEGDRVLDLDSTAEVIYEYESGSWGIKDIPSDGNAVIVTDDGDGDPALYVYQENVLSWLKIADGTIVQGNTLDQAYDQGGAGAGRTVNVDSGPMQLSASGGYSPIELTDLSSPPDTGLAAGQLASVGGRLYIYDSTAALFLSVDKNWITIGKRRTVKNQYLNIFGSEFPSNLPGFPIPEDMIIQRVWGTLQVAGTCDIEIYKVGTGLPIYTLEFTASVYENEIANINLDSGDELFFFCANNVNVSYPFINIELAYRK